MHQRAITHDGTGGVVLAGALVINVHFVGTGRSDFLRVGNADENAAVRVMAYPELGADMKVAIAVFRQQMAAALAAFVSHDAAVFRSPVGVTNAREVIKPRLAIDQRDPRRIVGRYRAAE